MLIASVVCACNDRLDIKSVYGFDLATMPYNKSVVQGGTVEIRCTLKKEGDYADAKYYIRYFQTDGEGELRLDNGHVLTPNNLLPLKKDVFRLYYTSRCNEQQTIDVYVEDSAGQVVQKTFEFNSKKETATN
jgi:hypothetical protein